MYFVINKGLQPLVLFQHLFYHSYFYYLNALNCFNLLFKIERSRDADEVYYEVNTLADGTLDTDNSIRIYRVKHTENGQTELLTKIQKSLAYGSMKAIEH